MELIAGDADTLELDTQPVAAEAVAPTLTEHTNARPAAPAGGVSRADALGMRLRDFFDSYYRPLRLRGRSASTVRLYGCVFRSLDRHLGREPLLADLDELALSRYLEARATQVSALTCERERTQLCALAALAWERRLLDTKPCCPPAPIPERVPCAWTVGELRAVMAAASTPATYPRGGEWKARFFAALLPVAFETGERIGALMESRVDDFKRPHLVVRAEARKGKKRDRLYRLTDDTCDRIEAAIGGRTDGVVFAWPLSYTYLFSTFGHAVKAAGLDTRKRLRFHQVRRSAASHYAAAGGDAVEMLDHSSPKVTRRWYLDPRLIDNGARPCDVLPSITAGVDTGSERNDTEGER